MEAIETTQKNDSAFHVEQCETLRRSLQDAADQCGVSLSAVMTWLKKYEIPGTEFDDEGKPIRIPQSEIDKVVELKGIHNKLTWIKHTGWAKIEETDEEDAQEEAEAAPSLASKVAAKAKECKEKGETYTALVLYELLCDHCEWNGVT